MRSKSPVWSRSRSRLHFGLAAGVMLAAGYALPALGSEETEPSQSLPAISTRGTTGALLSVRVVPEEIALWGVDATQRVLVMGTYDDGRERDLTLESSFSVSDPMLAEVDKDGCVAARSDGEAVLTADAAGKTAKAKIRIEQSRSSRPFSFRRDIGGLFTKHGCNASACHGNVKGRGGFKLSMNALNPQEDYRWIVKGGTYQVLTAEALPPIAPRIDLKEPAKSLLLLKPTRTVAHGGGRRFEPDSPAHKTLLKWIESGAPFGDDDVRITRLSVFPRDTVLDSKSRQLLLITATFSDGRTQDVTDQVLYVSQNPEVAKVDSKGLVEAGRAGETTVTIRGVGHNVITHIGVIDGRIADYPEITPRNFIDEHVLTKLRKLNIVPSELSSDEEFLRRVCLDLTGTLPPAQRVRKFVASKDPEKRDKLIEILLASPEYVDYWTFRFSELLRVDFTSLQSLMFGQSYLEWIRDSIAQNKPYDELARERIAAQGVGAPKPNYYKVLRLMEPHEIMAEQVRVFWGRRLDCAQCHDHPFESWSQNQYWGLASFFDRMTEISGPLSGIRNHVLVIDDLAGHGARETGPELRHPRTKEVLQPRYFDGKLLPDEQRVDPRMRLAEYMTAHPYFSGAAVNRVWGYFFGRGLVDPVDDFRTENPATHPELLAELAEDFRSHGFDLKHLMRQIVQSRTYQLSATPNDSNLDDTTKYSRAFPRALEAEILLDAISRVTGVEEKFSVSPFWDSGQGGRSTPGTRAINLIPELFPSHFLHLYGRPISRRAVADRKADPDLWQALHMLVGPTYSSKLGSDEGRVAQLLQSGATDRQVIEELYLAAFSRFPTEEEQATFGRMIRGRSSRKQAIENLMWALICSREFAYNH